MRANIVQIKHNKKIYIGKLINEKTVRISKIPLTLFSVIVEAIQKEISLLETIDNHLSSQVLAINDLLKQGLLTFPVRHKMPHHTWFGGTGLTHHHRAEIRKTMEARSDHLTDSQRIYLLGLKEGKTHVALSTARPEWFFKGHLSNARTSGEKLAVPWFDLGGGEEAELVGVYYISAKRKVYRIGFCLGNEFADHVLEKENHFYITQCKLRPFSIGHEIIIGEMPEDIRLEVNIWRDNEVYWKSQIFTGEQNMIYSYENIENFIFQNEHIGLANSIYYHFMGTSNISYSENITLKNNDRIEISSRGLYFVPLENTIDRSQQQRSIKATLLK